MKEEVMISIHGENCTEVRDQFNVQKYIYQARLRKKTTNKDFLENLLELDRERTKIKEVNNIE